MDIEEVAHNNPGDIAELLKTTNLVPAETMQEAAAKIVELAYAAK